MIGDNFATHLGNTLLFLSLLFSTVTTRFVNLVFVFISLALLLLLFSYVTDDLSLRTVYSYSSSSVPLKYKISGLWASPEGSLLLLVWVISFYKTLYANFTNNEIKQIALNVQSFIFALFLLFIIFSANPFQSNDLIVKEGLGLNPLLQDVALTIHPPILYLGYFGFSIIFSIAIAYCYKPSSVSIGAALKPWVLLTWSFLTVGIGLGSWWAYRELGWGGFWFWDPVENISLIPWILGLALIHATSVVEKHTALTRWVVFLAIITFIVSLAGTFLIRSVFLNSVHSFAGNEEQVIYMIAMIFIVGASGIISYIVFHKRYQSNIGYDPQIFSWESSIILNNWFLVISGAVIFTGVIYPLIAQYFTSNAVIISSSYYNSVLQQILLPFLLIWVIGPQLVQKKGMLSNNCISLAIACLIVLLLSVNNLIMALLLIMSLWLFFSMIISYLTYFFFQKCKIDNSYYGMLFSHLGGAMLVFAIVYNAYFAEQKDQYMQIGETLEIHRYKLKLERIFVEEEDNYKALKGNFSVNSSFHLIPEIRFYKIEGQSTAETAIHHDFLSNLYVVISEIDEESGLGVEIHYNPLINLVWFSVILIGIGGVVSIITRRASQASIS